MQEDLADMPELNPRSVGSEVLAMVITPKECVWFKKEISVFGASYGMVT